ncbi:MAG: tetratricopeptide repeat protein [Bacteroidetes bacterium]|nr:tetratricopeptide repeat protein [Bacteroidota bacterium]
MRKYLKPLFFLMLLIPVFAGAQDMIRVDSLVTELERESTDTTRCRIMLEIATSYKTTDTTIALEYLRNVKSLARELPDKSYLGRCFEIEGEMKVHFGRYDEAIIDYDRAMAFYNEADNDIGYYETMKDKGNVYLYKGVFPRAMNYYETALDYYRRNNMVDGASRCLNNMGIIYKNQGRYVNALSVYDESISIIDPEQYPMQIAKGYINMGTVFVYLGTYERALEYFEKALEISEKAGSRQDIALCLINSGVVQNKCSNFQEALELYNRALEIGRAIGDPIMVSNCLINIGTNYSILGKHKEGLQYVERGRDMKVELGDRRAISNCLIHMAEIHSKLEEYDRATELFMEAIPIKEELSDQEALVRCYLGLASISFSRRNFSNANLMSDRALEIASELHSMEHITTGYNIKSDIAEARGDFRSAYQYATTSDLYRDSMIDEATSRAAMEMEFRHRSRALEKENNNLKIQSELTSQLMRKRTALMYSVAGIAILLTALVILGGYFLRRLKHSSLKLEEKNLVITRQNMELDAMNRTKDRMMSIIAHDLRGTMGNQITAIEVLHRVETSGRSDFDRKKLMGNLKHSASYSLELLENLLLWSRLEETDTYYNPGEVSLDIIVTGCMALFDESAHIKNISVIKQIDDGLTMHADRIMLEAIIRNLLSNAIKFTESGGSISITAQLKEETIRIAVADNGIGMTEKQSEKLLHKGGFSSRGTANEKGAGIGMTLVREFTTLHRGKLTIKSKSGEGTSVTISFPRGN